MFNINHLNFVGSLYNNALNPGGWGEVLTEFCSIIGAGGCSMHAFDTLNATSIAFAVGGRADESLIEPYNKLFADTDAKALDVLFKNPRREFLHDFELLGMHDIKEIESYPPVRWNEERLGLFWRVATRMNITGAWLDVLTVQYQRDHGPMSNEEKTFAMSFIPHFAKTVELSRAFRILESRFRAVLSALDRLNIGVFITQPNGQVIIHNDEARRIVGQGDGISLNHGSIIVLSDDDERRILLRAISETSATADSNGNRSEALMRVTRRSELEDYLLAISPLRDDNAKIDDRFRGSLIFAIDPEHRQSISTAGMEILFGLTSAEADVLKKLLHGAKTNQIADMRHTKPETVRNQIKSIFKKTNTNKQADLVRLAVTVNPPIDMPDDK